MTDEEFRQWLHRQDKPRSQALPAYKYGDPAKFIVFEREKKRGVPMEGLGTKEIEGILRHELENWIRWGRKKDWLPVSFRCPLGFLYKSEGGETVASSLPCDGLEAAKLERIVVGLPQKHRQAFVMHQLDRAAVRGVVVIVRGRDDKARLLGLHKSRYHEVLSQAFNMVYREWQKINTMKY